MSDSLQASEALSARGATSPRVTLADLEAAIAETCFFTGSEAAVAAGYVEPDRVLPERLQVLTVCILVTKGGYVLIGSSAPADSANFDAEKGRTFARADAIRQLWPLMGFALRERLAAGDVVTHASDCAAHNEPAMPAGPCDCGTQPVAPHDRVIALDMALRIETRDGNETLALAEAFRRFLNAEEPALELQPARAPLQPVLGSYNGL